MNYLGLIPGPMAQAMTFRAVGAFDATPSLTVRLLPPPQPESPRRFSQRVRTAENCSGKIQSSALRTRLCLLNLNPPTNRWAIFNHLLSGLLFVMKLPNFRLRDKFGRW